ncbi:MAG: nucleoside deaminase, partial [Deltaproteobacteria bacterium]|nr:nucleoside deaminase [Deltaproteobacteria bacterium]
MPAPRRFAEDTNETYLRQAFAMAEEAIANGNPPFGAALVKDGQVIARTPNTAHTDHNISHHAETNCLGAAARKLGYWGLEGSTLYSSCEPCEMCCELIFLTGVKKLVYGLSAERFAKITGFRKAISAKTYFNFANDKVEVVG